MGTKIASLAACAFLVIAMVAVSSQQQTPIHSLAAYATGLDGRTPNQQYNARKAARLVDGSIIQPGSIFSFNDQVGGWTAAQGFRRAPVSYNGILIDDYGGGVCQTSSTIYNAALAAGLMIVERHSHTFAPGYVPAGRDAAVAYQNVDLRLKNPYDFPVILHTAVNDGELLCAFTAPGNMLDRVNVESKILDTFPAPLVPPEPGAGFRRSRWHLKGKAGVRVATYRRYYDRAGHLVRTELVSDNTYEGITAASWAVGQH